MTPVNNLLDKLQGVKKSGKNWSARCPAHDDYKASLSIAEGDDGRALVWCHAGCALEDIRGAVGLAVTDLFPPPVSASSSASPRKRSKERGKPGHAGKAFPTAGEAVADLERRLGKRSAFWPYHDAEGKPVGLVVRWDGPEGKEIRPVSLHPDGWRIAGMPETRPLYRLPDLAQAGLVLVTEGEKAADAARSLDFTATTSSFGAKSADKTDWRPLAGKRVWVLPDNDAPGREYADEVARIVTKLTPPAEVKLIELPGLPDGGDIVDWIEAHGDAAEPAGMRAEIEALAREVEPVYVEPSHPEDAGRFRPFPVDALPEPVGAFVAAGARAIGCDPSYVALPLLVGAAAAIGNTRRLELKRGWEAPPILWAAIVGDSGTGKTPAFKLALAPFRERERRAHQQHESALRQHRLELARWEQDMAARKRNGATMGDPPAKSEEPTAERFMVSDTTVEALASLLQANPRGLLLCRDELAGWIGSFDRYASKNHVGADASHWVSMFNAEPMPVDRKTGSPRTIHVAAASVCVVGGIQPGTLRRALSAQHRESGLAARLLLAFPPRKSRRWTEADIDPASQAELAQLVDRLYGLQPGAGADGEARPVVVRLSEEAKAAWIEYYNANAEEQDGMTGDLSAALSKLEESAARLALVIHFLRWAAGDPALTDENTVDVDSMRRAIALAAWFKHEARHVYAMLSESEAEQDQRRLIEWVGRKGGTVTARETQQGCRWLKGPGEAEAALEALVKAGRGVWEAAPAGQKGRPPRRFNLSPASTVYGNAPRDGNRNSVDVDSVGAAPPSPDPTDFPFGHNRPDDARE